MNLIKISEAQKTEYQSFVKQSRIFLQDWEWGSFQQHRGRKAHKFLIKHAQSAVFACQLIENRTAGKLYLFAPYGPVFADWVLQDQNLLKDTIDFFLKELKSLFPRLLFVRIEPQFDLKPLWSLGSSRFKKTINSNPHKTLKLDLDQDEENILRRMHPKTRYNIRIGEKRGVQIQVVDGIDQRTANLFKQTARRSRIRPYPYEYLASILEYFKNDQGCIRVRLYVARHADQLLSAAIILYYNNETAFYLFGASADDKGSFKGSHLIQWQAIKDAKLRGCKYYDFWGIEEDTDHPWAGFSKFKIGFGGEVKTYAGTYDYVYNLPWYNAYAILRKLNRLMRK